MLLIPRFWGTVSEDPLKLGVIVVSLLLLCGCATPLHRAAKAGDVKRIQELLDSKRYDVNAQGSSMRDHMTPLHEAAYGGHLEAARLLLDRGADVNAKTISRYDPLTFSLLVGTPDVSRLLIERGADVDVATARLEQEVSRGVFGPYASQAQVGLKTLERLARKPQAAQTAGATTPIRLAASSDIDALPAVKGNAGKNAFAVVVGIEQYRQKLPKADFAARDAQSVSDYLTKVLGYQEENVVLLRDDRAGFSDLVKYFEKWLPSHVNPDSAVFVYYSGHGAPNPKTGDAFLVPYDGDPSFIAETGYPLRRLYDALGRLPSKRVLVALDSCFSGAGGRSVIAAGARPLVSHVDDDGVLAGNLTVLAAASSDQIGSTYEEQGHGLFTYFMLKGIKEAPVTKPDGSLDVRALYEYLKPEVEKIARKAYGNEQTPRLISPKR